MQDLVLQYLKKTVLRPRAIGKSEFLGGQVIVHCLFELKGFAFIPGILSGMEGQLPPPPSPYSDGPVTLLYWFFILRITMKNSLPEVGHLQDSMRWSFDKIC